MKQVEGDTRNAARAVRALAPGPHVDAWLDQELGHEEVDEIIGNQLEFEFHEVEVHPLSDTVRRISRLVRCSRSAARIMRYYVGLEGYINEGTNQLAQRALVRELRATGREGLLELARTFGFQCRQEGIHKDYYHEQIVTVLGEMRLWERRLTEELMSRRFGLVGTDDPEREYAIGLLVDHLANEDEDGMSGLTSKVDEIAGNVLPAHGAKRISDAVIACRDSAIQKAKMTA